MFPYVDQKVSLDNDRNVFVLNNNIYIRKLSTHLFRSSFFKGINLYLKINLSL